MPLLQAQQILNPVVRVRTKCWATDENIWNMYANESKIEKKKRKIAVVAKCGL